ncbi:MAG: hypothetical protein ABSC06_40160 [Rhodopila sp.]|jgi:hypothetical protein
MPKLGTTIWDAALARRLYDEGASYTSIGEQIGAAPSLIGQFAARHWPPRDKTTMAYQPGGRKRDATRRRPRPAGRSAATAVAGLRGPGLI